MPESTEYRGGLKAWIPVQDREGRSFLLRPLQEDDAALLAGFFASLSELTRLRFGPHSLDEQTAHELCAKAGAEAAWRFVLSYCDPHSHQDTLAGYFIIDPVIPAHEAERYRNYGIELEDRKDCMFAPCIADPFQDRGLGGAVMKHLLEHCRLSGCRSLVLLGGTREDNPRAIRFYEKPGFVSPGGYQTDVYNLDMRLLLE